MRGRVLVSLLFVCLLAASGVAQSVELQPETRSAFDHYIAEAELRMRGELRPGGPFLLPDAWPADRRDQAYQQLRRSEVRIERVIPGEQTQIPHGIIHDWTGVVFIPRASVASVLALIQNYDHHQDIYAPEVLQSRLMRRNGDDFHIFLRLRKHKVTTVVLNTEYNVHFMRLDAHHTYSMSHSTRIAEVQNPGGQDERELPPGKDHGFLWALDTYWRFFEVEDGTFVQCEAISLTRNIPAGLGWLIGPIVESLPRQSLEFTLATTRKAIADRSLQAGGPNADTGTKD